MEGGIVGWWDHGVVGSWGSGIMEWWDHGVVGSWSAWCP